jgi:hypothetical protein
MGDDEEVMENPYLQSRVVAGLFWAAGHSPNHAALATRKTCQNDEILDSFAPLTTPWSGHISPRRSQRLSRDFACAFGR